ncbi:MAG TPA: ferredoxin [Acidimicrobiales bacterium]|nr:ferredoxin [Acidimicrobiales bacterium]
MSIERRLQVDPVACDGFGHCAELLPEFIALDEWGYPVVEDAPLPASLTAHVDRAVKACPRRALRVRGPAKG